MEEKAPENVENLKIMAQVLEKLQMDLEPIRDKALDEVARLTGYSQCAEQMIKIIVGRMAAAQKQIKEIEERANKVEEKPKKKKKEVAEG
jgi:hypothetical protein